MVAAYRFSRDWFSAAPKGLAPLLAPLAGRPNLRFAVVGVLEGRATVWLLNNTLAHPTARLDCIDAFVWQVCDGRPAGTNMRAVKHRFHSNIERSGAAHKVRLFEMRSDVALCTLPRSSYDFIYIDGSHRGADVLSDAVLSFRLLKRAGLLIFDDY
jgi:hypothetical protein